MKQVTFGPTCRRCSEPVDLDDDYCPRCGFPIVEPKPGKRRVREQRK